MNDSRSQEGEPEDRSVKNDAVRPGETLHDVRTREAQKLAQKHGNERFAASSDPQKKPELYQQDEQADNKLPEEEEAKT